jgi:hypothetical protein
MRRHESSIWTLVIGLVIVTTGAVALVVHATIPALPWAMAFVLFRIRSHVVCDTLILDRVPVERAAHAARCRARCDLHSCNISRRHIEGKYVPVGKDEREGRRADRRRLRHRLVHTACRIGASCKQVGLTCRASALRRQAVLFRHIGRSTASQRRCSLRRCACSRETGLFGARLFASSAARGLLLDAAWGRLRRVRSCAARLDRYADG